MGRFSPATSSTVGGEVGKDTSKKGTTSAGAVVQAFVPTSSNLQHHRCRRPNATRVRLGSAMDQQQPRLAAAPRKRREKPIGESAYHRNRLSRPATRRSGQLHHGTNPRKRKGRWREEEDRDQKKPHSPSPPASQVGPTSTTPCTTPATSARHQHAYSLALRGSEPDHSTAGREIVGK